MKVKERERHQRVRRLSTIHQHRLHSSMRDVSHARQSMEAAICKKQKEFRTILKRVRSGVTPSGADLLHKLQFANVRLGKIQSDLISYHGSLQVLKGQQKELLLQNSKLEQEDYLQREKLNNFTRKYKYTILNTLAILLG